MKVLQVFEILNIINDDRVDSQNILKSYEKTKELSEKKDLIKDTILKVFKIKENLLIEKEAKLLKK